MRSPQTLLTTLSTALILLGCGPGESPNEVQASEEPPIDMEGMEDWAYLLGHTTPYESATEWDGDLDGFKTEWHPGGSKSGEGEYRDSKRVGAWTFWHENGHKRWEGTYEGDVPTGLERAWYEDGTLHYEGSYKDGLRHGAFSYWYPSGRQHWKGSFVKGKREGVFLKWLRNGTIDEKESGIYRNGAKLSDLLLEADGTTASYGEARELAETTEDGLPE